MQVSRKVLDGKTVIRVDCDYHPQFVEFARQMKAKFNGTNKAWYFDERDEEGVHEALKRIYGTDGTYSPDVVDVRFELDQVSLSQFDFYLGKIVYGGRVVAQRRSRDTTVILGHGVIVESGGFPQHGGSVAHPGLNQDPGTVLLVKDVPQSLAQESKGIQIVARSVPESAQPDDVSTSALFSLQAVESAMREVGVGEDVMILVLSKLSGQA